MGEAVTSAAFEGQTVRAELRALASLAWPVALAQLGLVTLGLVEIAVVGSELGPDAVLDLGAVAIGRSIAFTSLTLGMGTAAALEPLAAQAIGAGNPSRAWRAFEAALGACAVVGVVTTVIALLTTLALVPIGIAPEVMVRVRGFLLAQIPAAMLMLAFLCGKTFLQAHGRTRAAVIAVVAANAVNFVSCNLLVRGDDALAAVGLARVGLARHGAVGAGLASSLATAVLAVIVVIAAYRQRADLAGSASAVIDPILAGDAGSASAVIDPILAGDDAGAVGRVRQREVYALGLPIGFQYFAEVGVFGFVALLAGRLGPDAVAAHQVALGIASFTYMGATGISGATAVRVGLAVGARRSPHRPGALGIAMGGLTMCVPAVIFTLFPEAPVGLFTHDARVIAIAVPLIRIAAFFQLFDGIQTVAGGALRGAGDTRVPFVLVVVSFWVVGFPLALLFGFGLGHGARGLWWGLTAGLVSASILLSTRFWRLRGRYAVTSAGASSAGTSAPPLTS